jgi:hypothetical protein
MWAAKPLACPSTFQVIERLPSKEQFGEQVEYEK